MDLIPGIACAAHFVILADRELETIDDYVNAGRAVQRFWLSATKLGLLLQPEMTPLIFSGYVREGRRFSKAEGAWSTAEHLSAQLDNLVGGSASRQAFFMGRIGVAPVPEARSTRLPLHHLKAI